MRKAVTVTALGLAVLLTGCGGSDTGDSAEKSGTTSPVSTSTQPEQSTPTPTEREVPEAREKGLDGTWRPINKSPIATLTITGTKVTTTGELACPGTVTGAGTTKPRLTLNCKKPSSDRAKGTLELKRDGSALIIEWDGPAWGGMVDSLRRA